MYISLAWGSVTTVTERCLQVEAGPQHSLQCRDSLARDWVVPRRHRSSPRGTRGGSIWLLEGSITLPDQPGSDYNSIPKVAEPHWGCKHEARSR